MRKLIPYENNQNEILKKIYGNKRSLIKDSETGEEFKVAEVVENIHDNIIKAYSNYLDKKRHLENLSTSICNEKEKKAMINCYEQSTRALEELKSQIKINQHRNMGNLCQFCGINSANTFDHYVPKSIFPEFSVFAPNLIPCCGECNSLKLDNWLENERLFLNLYYDTLPIIQIIHANIFIEDNLPIIKFSFIKNEHGEELFKALENCDTIKEHYMRLKLLDRFKENCNNYLYEIVDILSIKNKILIEEIIKHLEEEFTMTSKLYGINHWKTILVKGLIDSREFINWCSKN